MLSFYNRRHVMISTIVMLVLAVGLGGCESLRKKFTRQKRKGQVEDTTFIPVLEPQEYPAPQQNPPENYKEHYALVKVWYKDLWTVIEEKRSDKKAIYTINQILSHLDEMKKLVLPEKQAELVKLADLLTYFKDSLNSPPSLRNISRIQSDLRAFDRLLRNQLSAGKLDGFFVKASQ